MSIAEKMRTGNASVEVIHFAKSAFWIMTEANERERQFYHKGKAPAERALLIAWCVNRLSEAEARTDDKAEMAKFAQEHDLYDRSLPESWWVTKDDTIADLHMKYLAKFFNMYATRNR
jgi:hypothetical protein